jgi:hypothetical protein
VSDERVNLGWMTKVQFLAEEGFFFLHDYAEAGTVAHVASYVMGGWLKCLYHKSDHLLLSSAGIQNL